MPLHKIPNVCIGSFPIRGQLRLIFPQLYRSDEPASLSQIELALIYNKGILPTIKAILPERAAHWPPSYTTELIRAADNRGKFHFGSVDLPEDTLPVFAANLRTALAAQPRLGKPYFQLEIRGSKCAFSCPLDVDDPSERERMFNLFVENINLELISNPDNWFVDVGIEIHQPGHVVQWLSDAHNHIVSHCLPSLTAQEATRVTALSAFHEDLSRHLYDLSGFRVEPGERGRADNVVYINCYTTDKTITYQLHSGIFRQRTAADLYPGPLPKLCEDLSKIIDTFAICGGSEGHTQDGTARLETRVRLSSVHDTLTSFPQELLQVAVVSFPNEDWWYVVLPALIQQFIISLSL